MRVLKERPLVSILKFFVDFAYYGVIAMGLLVVLVITWVAVAPPGGMSLDLPARFEIDRSAYEITSDVTGESEIWIEQAEGQIKVTSASPRRAIQGFSVAGLSLLVAFFALRQFRGIFRSLKAGKPFMQANVRRIRMLGLAVIVGEVLRAALVAWTSGEMGRYLTSEQIQFRSDFQPSVLVIFAGLLLLVLAEVFREAAVMKRDLETAREIQFELVAAEEFSRDRIHIRSRMRPANTVGGDYYDIITLDEKKVAVVQADVAGKGMPAALLMAVLQGSLRTLISAGFRGARLVGELNNYLNDNTPSNRMITLFYGELDTTSGEMTFVNAGHNLPFLIRGDGTLDRPGGSSMVAGIMPDVAFEECSTRLEAGERLLLFTDGVSEAFDAKETEYGDERVADHLQRHRGSDSETLVGGLVQEVLTFCKPSRPTDDMTLTLLTRE